MLDEHGYPTNPAYLEAQGFDLVNMNRDLVETQEQIQNLGQFYSLLLDPATRDQALADLDAAYQEQNGGQSQQSQYQRPNFPGRNTEVSQEAAWQAFERARSFGAPAGQEQISRQLWQQVPADLQASVILRELEGL